VVTADTAAGLANWFATVAEAEQMAEAAAAKPTPNANQPPANKPPAVGNVALPVNQLAELDQLIKQRNALVDRTKLFALLAQVRQGKPLDKPQEKTLRGALPDWFKLYFQMRNFQPVSRRDPNLAALSQLFEQHVTARPDFVEGRVLGAICEVYRGNFARAQELLQQASQFLTDHALNPSPTGHDCCRAWLVLGRPEAVVQFVDVLKDMKAKKSRKSGITDFQAWLVATYAWQTFRYNEAKEFFELALNKAKVWQGGAANAPGLVADAAAFYLLAGAAPPRDPGRGEKLIGLLAAAPPAHWSMQRAQAALKAAEASDEAAQGNAAAAAALWAEAVQELRNCRSDCLPVLDGEIDEQLHAYQSGKPWYRERPKPVPKPGG